MKLDNIPYIKRYLHLLAMALCSVNAPLWGQQVAPGLFEGSYVLTWNKSGVISRYEYILTDNPQCTSGCLGDTKEAIVQDTSVLVFPTFQSKTYYWRIRPVLQENGDGGDWSSIYRFYVSESNASAAQAIFVAPNPCNESHIQIRINWNLVSSSLLEYKLFKADGSTQSIRSGSIEKPTYVRDSDALIEVEGISKGLYMLDFFENNNIPVHVKVIIR
ncbi:MAG: hypothetical protein MUF42_10230 [Cytophagaceae bacterium]|jgi:hypothetical protein|nr:hypothetical protein [Cytophagaceae bacterium]